MNPCVCVGINLFFFISIIHLFYRCIDVFIDVLIYFFASEIKNCKV